MQVEREHEVGLKNHDWKWNTTTCVQVGMQHHNFPLQQWCLGSAPGHPIMRFMVAPQPRTPNNDYPHTPHPPR